MRKFTLIFIAVCSVFNSSAQTITKIAFGSCGHQNANQDILYKVTDKKPDIFIYLGDNIYGDTKNMELLQKKYDKLGNKAPHQNLRENTKVLAIWDDHDYGKNDAGKEYPKKEESKAIFLDFWEEPDSSTRYNHEGIYHAEYYGSGDSIVQVILLDTRTFRDRLKKSKKGYKHAYMPTDNKKSTFLGEEQWLWLEEELQNPATIRIIASSNQFAHEYNGYESWTNMPHEQQKMLDIIERTQANGVVFISGDVHWGELSKMETENTYPIYDMTSSGLTQEWRFIETNINRIDEAVAENNFGLIEINWVEQFLTLNLYDINDSLRIEHAISFDEIEF